MAEEADKESKTEEPTEKKVSDAVEKGNVPRSRELSIFASLLGVLVACAFFVGPRAADLAGKMMLLIDHPGGFSLDTASDIGTLLWAVVGEMARFLLPIIFVLALAGLSAAFFQHAPTLALEQVRPKWSRVSPAAGWKRLFSGSGMVEFLKSLFKFGAIAAVCLVMLGSERSVVVGALVLDPAALPELVLSLVVRLASAVCVAIALIVAADVVWSRIKWRRDLRMTRQELKDEFKQSEGDPIIKSRLRSLARDRARRRMIAAVPQATVVIANPTHFAVALKYDRAKGGAPVVVAKGADLVALRIREIASRHAVPIVEDKPLARALYDAVDVGQWIPAEFYRAVARILHLLYARPAHART